MRGLSYIHSPKYHAQSETENYCSKRSTKIPEATASVTTESSPSFGADSFPLHVRSASTKNSRNSLLLSNCSTYCKSQSFSASQNCSRLPVKTGHVKIHCNGSSIVTREQQTSLIWTLQADCYACKQTLGCEIINRFDSNGLCSAVL